MGLLAALLIPIVLFFWFAFCFTLWAWFKAIVHLCKLQFIRASLWFNAGVFMLFWWFDTPHDWDTMMPGIVFFTGLGALGTVIRYYLKRKSVSAVPAWTTPADAVGNVVPFVKATKAERERVMTAQSYRCANPYCNADLRQSTPHWDYITPRSKGGTDSVDNMLWLCDVCNSNKQDMGWLEFLYRYATSLGIDPNKNQKPWQQWVVNRVQNGLGTCVPSQ